MAVFALFRVQGLGLRWALGSIGLRSKTWLFRVSGRQLLDLRDFGPILGPAHAQKRVDVYASPSFRW